MIVRRIRWYHRLWNRLILMRHPNYHAFKGDLRSIWTGR
jgi:hypothetical protein